MDSGSEITAKIRSAIKAKLVELGAYVDDELPDYIMVMIANKKTKEQMSDDLNLFLGKNSNIFTEWVHGVLDRLQAISQKTVSSIKDKSSDTIKKPAASSSSIHPLIVPKIEKITPEKRSTSKQDVKENKPKQTGDKRSSKKSNAGKNDEKIFEKIGEEDVLEMHPVIAGDELDEEIAGKSKQFSSDVNKKSSQRKRIEAPPSSSRNRNRPAKRRTPSPDEPSSLSRKRRSVVSQVVKKEPNEYDDNEEYDPTHPQLGSVVKVSQRKYKVPVTMQPKPSIFLKALNEANASVSRRTASPPRKRTRSPAYVPKSPPHVSKNDHYVSKNEQYGSKPSSFSTNRQSYDNSDNNKDRQAADFSADVEMASDEEYVPEHPKFALPHPPNVVLGRRYTRRVEFNEPPPPGATTGVEESGEELIVDTSDTSVSKTRIRFVVTLDGVSSSFVKKVKDKQDADNNSTMHNGTTNVVADADTNNDIDDQDTLIVGVEEERLDEQATNQLNEVKICLDDDEDDDGEIPTGNSSVVATIGDTISDDGEKVLERCKYWPACKLGTSCQYIHPTVPCKTFPNCRFGDRCVYIHPNCRYDSFCSNQHCIYVHSSNQRRIASVVQNSIIPKAAIKSNTPLCKFGTRCLNHHCQYKHPKPCLFGLSCSRIDCTFSHPVQSSRPSPPLAGTLDVKKFRWVAPPSKSEPNLAVAAE